MSKTKWPGKVIPLVVTLLVVALALGLSSGPVPTLAAPAVASVTETAFGSDTTTHNVSMPATVNAGNLLIVLFNNDGSATVTTPAGWTQLASNATGTAVRLSIYYKIAAGTEGGTTVNFNTSASEQAAAQVYRITDWHGTTPPEISTAATGTSTAADPSSLNPAGWDVANTLWLAVAGQDQGGGTPTYPVSYTGGITTRSDTAGNSRCQMMSARRVLAAASENPGAFTILGNVEEWVAFTIAVRPEQRNLTTSSTTGGNVTSPGEGVFSYDEGAVVDLVATPDASYRFVNWTGNVSTIADIYDAETTITMNGNYSIIANFLAVYDLTISSTEGGSVTEPGEGPFLYDEGTVVDLIAGAEECYEFDRWTGDVESIADIYAAETTITMNDSYNITANFALLSYNLTADSTDGGSVTDPGESTFTYDCGAVVDLVAEADACYEFVNWTGDVGTIADVYAASTNITMDGNKVVTATFTPIDCDYLDGWVEDGSPYTACNGTQACTYQDMVYLDYECVGGDCVPTETDWRTDLISCEDCDELDYYTEWGSYCNGTSIWRTRDFHDYYCFNGTCQEDVIPESEFVEDCPADYYTEWASYCNGTSIWRTRDFHDYYCFNGTCQEDVIPESEFVEDCPADYYTEWVSYCNGTSIWRTRDFHDYYCFNGTCQEDVIPESEFVEDCPADYYTEWASYCNGTSIWRTRDFHDYYCFNGTCQEDVIPESEWVEDCDDGDPCTIDTCENGQCVHTPIYEDILEYYRSLNGAPDEVDTLDLLAAADDWISDVVPPCFEEPITTLQLLQLADEWITGGP